MLRISPTQLDSFAYYLSIEDDDASAIKRRELIDYLKGIKGEPTESMLKGIQFEDHVSEAVNGTFVPTGNDAYDACIQEAFEEVKGSLMQVHFERELESGVWVHGFIDFLRANRIYDTKFCSNYDMGKYRGRNQHMIYLFCGEETGIDRFTYIATDCRNLWKEDYYWNPDYKDVLKSNLNEFLEYLERDTEMKEVFYQKMEKLCQTTTK